MHPPPSASGRDAEQTLGRESRRVRMRPAHLGVSATGRRALETRVAGCLLPSFRYLAQQGNTRTLDVPRASAVFHFASCPRSPPMIRANYALNTYCLRRIVL